MITRRTLVGTALLATVWPPVTDAAAQDGIGRPGVRRGARPGVDEALQRTVRLVLRAEARSGALPPFMTDPVPLPEEDAQRLVPGGPLPEDIEVQPVPAAVDRRLPHARRGSVWVVAGTWMMEIDPIRRLVMSIAYDVLPPDV